MSDAGAAVSDADAAASDADAVARPIAVVFDLDGTLVDTMHSMLRAYADTIRALGGPAVTPDDIVATWHIGPTPVVLAHFLGRPAEPSDLDCFRRYANAAASAARAFPGVAEMLDRLDEADCRLGVFTSATRHSADRVLAASGLVGYFTVVVCGDEARSPKPAPDGLVLACASLGVPVSDSVYVGDADVGLRCADAAGAHGIHAGWGGSLRVDSPHAVARTPGEVLELLTRLLGGKLGLAG
ncbi:phosphoglycolate phosphatase [Actinopolymorpha pittospori]